MIALLLFTIPIIVYFFSKNLILSNTVNSIIFVAAIIKLQHYELTFPLYIIAMSVLFLLHYKVASFGNKPFNIIYVTYMAVMMFVSIVNNYTNLHDVLAIFILNLLFPFIYLYLDALNKPLKVNKTHLLYLVAFVALLDLAISIVLFSLSPTHQAIVNHQPIGGGLAVAFLPLLLYLWSEKDCNKVILLVTSMVFGICVVFSGLRGYLLIYYGTFIVDILLHLPNLIHALSKKKFISISILLVICIGYAIGGSQIIEMAQTQLRLESALGRRYIENEYALKLIENRSIVDSLFGQGIGSKVKDIKSGYNFNFYSNNDPDFYADYEYSLKALDESISFHNTWTTMLISIGFVGFFLYAYFFILLIKRALQCHGYPKKDRIVLVAYILTLIIALTFRETLFRGVLEIVNLYFAMSINNHIENEGDVNV